jgi:hypothetical protein
MNNRHISSNPFLRAPIWFHWIGHRAAGYRVCIGAAAMGLAATLIPSARSQTILLTIDDSNPSAVIFTATGNFATANDSTTRASDGVDLLTFFTTDVGASSAPGTGNLSGGGAVQYDFWIGDQLSGSAFVDLNLFASSIQPTDVTTQTFSTTSAAFTGSMTIDLSGFTASLPSPGTVSDIQAGYSGTVVGFWFSGEDCAGLQRYARYSTGTPSFSRGLN